LKTANIQNIIKELDGGLIAKNGSITSINKEYAINILEGLLTNKINCEKMRLNPQTINKEDFL
jgi:hypothetical protein